MSHKHLIIADTQVRPGVPLDHLPWVAQEIVEQKPDAIVHIGDHWDMPSLSMHDPLGSLQMEGARYEEDIQAGNAAFEVLVGPMRAEQARLKRRRQKFWEPITEWTMGNHEARVDRAINNDPRFAGTIGTHHMNTQGFTRRRFLEVVHIHGIAYAHFFQMEKSSRPIGGTMENRFNKICGSFVCGHEQGYLVHRRPLPTGRTIHGIVAGSCYLHDENYRGHQRNNDWRGIVVLHDVRGNGDCEPQSITLDSLCRKYEGISLSQYLRKKYKDAEHKFTLARNP